MKQILLILFLFITVSCTNPGKKTAEENLELSEAIIEDSSAGKTGKPNKKGVVVEATSSRKSDVAATPIASGNSIYNQLNTHIKNQDEEAILKEGSRILMQNVNDYKALNAMAMVYYKKGQLGFSKSLLSKAIKNNPSFEVYSNLGIVNLAMDDKLEAVKNFKKAIEMNPNDTVSASNVGSIYVKANDFEKAVIALEIPYRHGNKDYRILSNYAVALVGIGKFERADQVYKDAIKENNNSKEVLFNYSILLIEHLKRHQEGLDYLQKLKFIGIPEESRAKVQELEVLARRELK